MRHLHRSSTGILRGSIVGLILIAAGVFLMLEKFGYLNSSISYWLFSWPMLLVVIGLINLSNKDNYRPGLILICIGGFFLIPRIFPMDFNFGRTFWPVLLIVGGLILLLRGSRRPRQGSYSSAQPFDDSAQSFNSDGFVECVSLFSGSKRIVDRFTGGKIVSIFGGSEIDLSQSTVPDKIVYLEVVSIFGGATIFVPEGWEVRLETLSIFGGLDDKRKTLRVGAGESDKTLVVKGFCLFGGGEIRLR